VSKQYLVKNMEFWLLKRCTDCSRHSWPMTAKKEWNFVYIKKFQIFTIVIWEDDWRCNKWVTPEKLMAFWRRMIGGRKKRGLSCEFCIDKILFLLLLKITSGKIFDISKSTNNFWFNRACKFSFFHSNPIESLKKFCFFHFGRIIFWTESKKVESFDLFHFISTLILDPCWGEQQWIHEKLDPTTWEKVHA